MDDARKKMGLGDVSGISRDVLHLKFDGQQLPNLTLVDLPGLIHASRNADDITMVQNLVEDYFRQERSIILTVVSAENPIENQGILTSSRRFDPKGTRSIGVITKPDVLERADKTSLRPAILELARNQNTAFQFTRGWHVVRCLNDKERNDKLDQDLVERTLFEQEPWKAIHHKQLGVKSLRSALGKYLHQHILQVLPELQTSLEKRMEVAKSSLEILGDSRTTPKERMRYLTRISKRYGELVKDALEGNYSDAFFQDGDAAKRLRATTMALTDTYEHSMRTKGHSFEISHEQARAPETSPHSPEQITQSDALLKVGKLLETYRGPELSFLFNPRFVVELFKEQSQKWPLLTSEYINCICYTVEVFLAEVVEFICPSTGETSDLIFRHVLDEAVQRSYTDLESKAGELFSPYTKSFLFSTNSRLHTSLKRIEQQDFQQEKADTTTQRQQSSGPEIMGSDYDTRVKLLQYSRAYYDVALETFIDNVVILGVESCLLSRLEEMFTPEIVVQMDEDILNLVGGESEDVRTEREELNKQLETLEDSLKRCRRHTSRLNRSQAKELAQVSPTGSTSTKVDGEGESQPVVNGHAVQTIRGQEPRATPSPVGNPKDARPKILPKSSDKNSIFSSAKPADTSLIATAGSIFSFPSATSPSGFSFGNPISGTRATSAPSPPAPVSGTSPFKSLATASQAAPASSGGLFGSTATSATEAPTYSGGLFGSAATSSAKESPAPSGGLFGSAAIYSAKASPAPSGDLFGSTTTPAQAAPAPSGGLFGSPATSTTAAPATSQTSTSSTVIPDSSGSVPTRYYIAGLHKPRNRA
jgi:GTP-binding protein EngB required for normal cell division